MYVKQANDKVDREIGVTFEITAAFDPFAKVHAVLTVYVVRDQCARRLESFCAPEGLTNRIVYIFLPELVYLLDLLCNGISEDTTHLSPFCISTTAPGTKHPCRAQATATTPVASYPFL